MDEDDHFASIMAACEKRRCREARLRFTPLCLPPATNTSTEEFPLYGAIPAHSLVNYLCCTPDTSNDNINNTLPDTPKNNIEYNTLPDTSSDNIKININGHETPLCVTSYQDSPPSPDEDFLLGSCDTPGITTGDHPFEGQRVHGENETLAVDGGGYTDTVPFKGLGLWLSKLKSMAITQEYSDAGVSFVTKFKASMYHSEKKNLVSSAESNGKRVSISGKPRSKKPKYSETKVGLGSSKYNTRSKSVVANSVNEVAPLEHPPMNKSFGMSSKQKRMNNVTPLNSLKASQVGSKDHKIRTSFEAKSSNNMNSEKFGMNSFCLIDCTARLPVGQCSMSTDGGCTKADPFNGSNMWLLKLKSIAKSEDFFGDAVGFFTKFRAEHWDSECLSHSNEKNIGLSSNSKAKRRLISVSGGPLSKKTKVSESTLGLKSSTFEGNCELVETERAAVIVLSQEGIGHKTVSKGISLTESDLGADQSHINANGKLSGNKSRECIGNTNDVCSSKGTNRCPAEPCVRDYLACGAMVENAATSRGKGSGSSSSKDGFLKMVLHAMQILNDSNPSGSSGNVDDCDGGYQMPLYNFPSA